MNNPWFELQLTEERLVSHKHLATVTIVEDLRTICSSQSPGREVEDLLLDIKGSRGVLDITWTFKLRRTQ